MEVSPRVVVITPREVVGGSQFTVFRDGEGSGDFRHFHVDLQDGCRQSCQYDAPSERGDAVPVDGRRTCSSLASEE